MLVKLLLLCSIFSRSVLTQTSTVVSKFGKINDGWHRFEYKYYYDSAINSCRTVYFLGVGTAMSVNDYEKLASKIVSGFDIVTIVSDHNPDSFIKVSARKYADYYNTMVKALQENFPVCNEAEEVCKATEEGCKETNGPRYIVGGHSASGQAAWKAIPKMNPLPDGFIGLDPFKIKDTMSINEAIPTLVWGFEYTTCGVKIDEAAKQAYINSNEKHRIFYRMDNPCVNRHGKACDCVGLFCGHAVEHCVFTDNGCMTLGDVSACPKGNVDDTIYDSIYDAVAYSIHSFADAMSSGVFIKTEFVLPALTYPGEHYDVFVNEDDV